jgi:hypothetical protein
MAISMMTMMLLGMSYMGKSDAAEDKPAKDEKAVTKQTICPVMGGGINKSHYVDKDGKRIYVCCPGCVEKVTQDFDKLAADYEAKGIDISAPKAQTHCPVLTKNAINKELFVDKDGKRIYVCCKSCKADVEKNFDTHAKALEEQNIDLTAPKDDSAAPKKDSAAPKDKEKSM